MARVIFDGLTIVQAKEFASWFEGQGEQDLGIWLEPRGVKAPYVDVQARPRWLEKNDDDFTVHCHTP